MLKCVFKYNVDKRWIANFQCTSEIVTCYIAHRVVIQELCSDGYFLVICLRI